MSARRPLRPWALVVVCVGAGALAAPPNAIATPVSAVAAGLVAVVAWRVWRWSGLPDRIEVEPARGVGRILRPAILLGLGLVVGLLLLAVVRLAVEPVVPAIGARISAAAALPIWRRVLIIYTAAIGEEVIFRLFLLSLVAGSIVRLLRRPDRAPDRTIVRVSIAVSAIAFAAIHLPAWSGAAAPGPALATAVLSLNALGGLVLGHVFVTRGIASAMWVHAGADCAIQLIGPLTG